MFGFRTPPAQHAKELLRLCPPCKHLDGAEIGLDVAVWFSSELERSLGRAGHRPVPTSIYTTLMGSCTRD